jgi:hypothetical protein
VEQRFQGERRILVVALDRGESILAQTSSRQKWQTGQTVTVTFSHACLFDGKGRLLGCREVPDETEHQP